MTRGRRPKEPKEPDTLVRAATIAGIMKLLEKEFEQSLLAAYEEGASYRLIADAVDMSPESVRRRLEGKVPKRRSPTGATRKWAEHASGAAQTWAEHKREN